MNPVKGVMYHRRVHPERSIRRRRSSTRGLSVLETMMSLTITVMVGAAIAGMLQVVSTGVGSRNDSRTVMISANAAQTRLGAYITPARCVLDLDADGEMVLWFNDNRKSGTVHATEIRWLEFDPDTDTVWVYYVEFPESWSDAAKALADGEYASSANWETVRQSYSSRGYLGSLVLLDGVESMAIQTDAAGMDARHFNIELMLNSQSEQTTPMLISATMRHHRAPTM